MKCRRGMGVRMLRWRVEGWAGGWGVVREGRLGLECLREGNRMLNMAGALNEYECRNFHEMR